MKILAPLSNVKEVKPLIDAGADELYFGISSVKDTDDTNCLNFRPIDYANLKSIEEAKRVIDITGENRRSSFLCLNAKLFDREHSIYKLLKQLAGLSGIIVTDISLLKNIKKAFPKLKLVASIRAGILNSHSVKFFKSLGVDRITAPLRLSFKEVLEMIEENKCEFEIFVRNEGCVNLSGFCNYTHNIWNDLCNDEEGLLPVCKKKKNISYIHQGQVPSNACNPRTYYQKTITCGECGICFLRFFSNGAKERMVLKIDGRLFRLERKLKDLEFIKRSAEYFLQTKSKKNIVRDIKVLHSRIYGADCMEKCSYKY